jgi:UDP-N-acetylglucosamine 2-epimerase
MFKEICKIINDLQDKKLIIKLHPAVTPSYSIQSILNKINPNISVFQTQNILPLLKDCEILVCLGHSTVLLESLILEKPTILFMTNQKWYEHDEIISSGAVLAVSSPDDLKNALKLILYDKNYREELIQKGNQFVEKYLSNLGTSSENLAKILEKL